MKRYDELIKRITERVMSGDLPTASAEKATDENSGMSTGATLAKISGAALGMFLKDSKIIVLTVLQEAW